MALLERVLNAKDNYEVLGVTSTATFRDIYWAFQKCIAELFPSKSANAICAFAFKRVCAAYDQLSDPVKRASYNFDIGLMTLENADAAATRWKEETVAAAGAGASYEFFASAGGCVIPEDQQTAAAAADASTSSVTRPGGSGSSSGTWELGRSRPPAAVNTGTSAMSMMDSGDTRTVSSQRRDYLLGVGLVAAGVLTVCAIRLMNLLTSRRLDHFGSK
nr:DnaJ-like protein [Volvox africanus]